MEKFKELVSKVHVLDATAVESLRNALWTHSPFKKDLYTNNNISLEDALHRVHCFITMKEDKHAYMIKHNAIKSFIAVKVEYTYQEPRKHSSYNKQDKKNSNYLLCCREEPIDSAVIIMVKI